MHNLSIFNTLSQRKELFKTITPGKVNMFVCGPTVQNLLHVGHARTYTFYDVVARYLSHLGYEVNFLMNVTDVDDKITQSARAERVDPARYAQRYTEEFLEDMNALRILTVTNYENVSGYIQEMIRQIATLIQRGHAYAVDGAVYFDTSTFPAYGALSHQSQNELILRPLELSPKKKNLLDFALWRPIELQEGRWDSPWGRGSPGWHIQDTAVTLSRFGAQYDIHGGAYELIYPHHEAEIAQAESITGVRPFVRYWVHTGLVNTKGNKMSKSAGNFFTVRDILKRHGSDRLRLYLLSRPYREDMEFDEERMRRWGEDYSAMRRMAMAIEERRSMKARRRDSTKMLLPFYEALDDDFDTPRAIDFVKRLVETGFKEKDQNQIELCYESLKAASNILGVDLFGKFR